MSILFKLYFNRLKLLRSLDAEENPGQRVSCRSCIVVNASIRIRQICLLMAEVEICFFILRHNLSLPGATFLSLCFQVLVD